MAVDAAGPTTITCPYCLAKVEVSAAAQPVLPLDYHGGRDDIEIEFAKDMRAGLWGIGVFAAMAVIGWMMVARYAHINVRGKYAFGWIGFVTALVALSTLIRQARRSKNPTARPKSAGERVTSVIVMGIGGLLLAAGTVLAGLILLFIACALTFRGI